MRYASIAVLTFLTFLISSQVLSQSPTVGLIKYDERTFEGYTLLSTHHSTTTYLLDNCGFVVHKWDSEFFPGNTVQLMQNGDLLRATKVNNGNFIAGGAGGRIEILDWEGNIKWEFEYVSEKYRHHHDVLETKNGNILLLAWDGHSKDEALAKGIDPTLLGERDDVWSEHLLEIQPKNNNEFEIVWEWYLWDHLIQDYDESKANYGDVSLHPELVNINFTVEPATSDWVHANAVSYNPQLDQIILSAHSFNEFWIIDHSTTTTEAKGHSGGLLGTGGDLAYRFGNPISYKKGTSENQLLYGQHNVHWTGTDNQIMLFNNGVNRLPEESNVVFLTPLMENGEYKKGADMIFEPSGFEKSYSSLDIEGFDYSRFLSGAISLGNDNILICSGANGQIVEITPDGETVWNYVNPITTQGIVDQEFDFSQNPVLNLVFRAYKYPREFDGFVGKDLSAKNRLEGNAYENYPCPDLITSISTGLKESSVSIFPNPVTNNLIIDKPSISGKVYEIKIMDLNGHLTQSDFMDLQHSYEVSTIDLLPGVYSIQIGTSIGIIVKRFIKL